MGENSWIIKVNEEVKHLSDIERAQKAAWERHSIYKLPASVADLVPNRYENAYKPRTISFGPYHHGELNLKPMEAHKERALLHFLDRSRKPLEYYVNALGDVVQDLKDSYDPLQDKWQQNSDAFLELMIRDGCFMLEVLTSYTSKTVGDYADNDPIFSKHGKIYMVPYIRRDMLMLENQLPMLLLRKLHDVYKQRVKTQKESIDQLIANFYLHPDTQINLDNCLHILDAHRKILLCKNSDSQNQEPTKTSNWKGHDEVLSVTKLEESGITIKKKETRSLLDIKFDDHRGILWLPQITVDDVSETMFLNLLAFERLHAGAGYEVTDYIYFMDKLIDDSKDVDILQSHEIIHTAIGSHKAVAKLFNCLSKDVVDDESGSLTEVRRKIYIYCKTDWHKWRASLKHTYFTNPWASISVFAAIFLFALTIFQAVYGALQYYHG